MLVLELAENFLSILALVQKLLDFRVHVLDFLLNLIVLSLLFVIGGVTIDFGGQLVQGIGIFEQLLNRLNVCRDAERNLGQLVLNI